MSMKRISGLSSVGFTGSGGDNSKEITSLQREKERLQQELSEVRTDSTMNSAEKKIKMQSISTKLNTISGKIQNLAQADTEEYNKVKTNVEQVEKKRKLDKEKRKLQRELQEVNTSTNIDVQERNSKVQQIMSEITSIQSEIRGLNIEDVKNMQYPPKSGITIDSIRSREKLEKNVSILLGFDREENKYKGRFFNKLDVLA